MQDNDNKDQVETNEFSGNDADNSVNENLENLPAEVEEIAQLKSELQEQKDKYVRLFAEFDNYRRRTSKENIELRQTASADLMVSLLEVIDDMDRAEQQLKEATSDEVLHEGIILVFNKFRRILQSKGLKSIETLHSEFDVEKDEAISEMEVNDENLKGKVVAEVQKGYLLNDKLIRYAKVIVGK